MSKFHLFSFAEDRQQLLDDLQKFEFVHFNDLKTQEDEELEDIAKNIEIPEELIAIDEEIVKADWAIDLLDEYVEEPGMIESLRKGRKKVTLNEIYEKSRQFDFEGNYRKLSSYAREIKQLEQDVSNIKPKIEDLYPWRSLPVTVRDLNSLQEVEVFTGFVPERFYGLLKEKTRDLHYSYIEQISFLDKNHYILAITTKEEEAPFLEILQSSGFTRDSIKADGLVKDEIEKYNRQVEEKRKDMEKVEEKIKQEKGLLESFQMYKDYLNNLYIKKAAQENFLSLQTVDYIEGFVPTKKEEDFKRVLDSILGNSYFVDISEAEKDDPDIPIILENKGFSKAFENMTQMYALPKYNEVDPTPLFAPFYAFFSGMMVGDAGYGLIVFLLTTFALHAFNLDEGKKNFVKFFRYISVCAIFWGLIYGSVFGGIIEMPALIDTSKDYIPMILISLAFGAIHLFFSVGIDTYMNFRDKDYKAVLFDNIFWYLILIAAIILVANFLGDGIFPANIDTMAKWLFAAMAIGIILTAGREAGSLGGKLGVGLYELYGISGWLGDFVSYLRLMALGLAGGFIGVAINIIVGMMFDSNIAVGAIGIVIFVVFHLFNVFLSYLSAYVHSARLTYVEMFNKFYEGGGTPFHKLVKESEYFELENK